jgi:transposase
MARPGPQKINRYGLEFKLRAVRMSEQSGVLVKDVAESLCIHPFMLSKWRKQVRDGVLNGKPPELDAAAVAELQRLREVEGKYRQLQMEHDLLKKAIRFVSSRKAKSLPSSRQTGKRGPLR